MLIRSVVAASFMVLAAGSATAGYVNNQLNQGWASFRDLTSAEFSAKFTELSNAGYRMIDVDAYPNGSGRLYSQVWEKNSDKRNWAEYRDMSSAQYGTRWSEMRDAGYRPSDFESYQSGSTQLYAGIWVKNTESWSWSSRRDMTATEYGQYFTEQKNAGRRPIDIEVYQTSGGLRYAAIWYQNAGNVSWAQLRDMSRDAYQSELNSKTAAGYRPIDFESYQSSGSQRYAVIWERNPAGRSWVLRSDRTELEFANYWRQYRDEGFRLVDFERYNTASGPRYAGLWVENDSRHDYSRKGTLDSIISNYRALNNLPGISVAVVRNGSMIYRRGFGLADINDGKVAHGETVYNAASVAKPIAGTLAGKLEAEDKLRDGTTFSLNLTQRTSSYLTNVPVSGGTASIPSFHTHNVDQLLSHLGCVAHYNTTPAIANQTTHRATAMDAVRSIWNTGLVQGCTIGTTRSYSTPAFTFVAAVVERVTGRSADTLVRTELSQPYGLPSLRVQFETSVLPGNYDRATPYNDNNTETTYDNSSWKMWSGGMELNAVDLANFGWKVLSGQIVSPTVRDNRLWAAVAPGCGSSTSGRCRYGLGWSRGTVNSRRVADHDGSWTGARAFIRAYRDDGLVIAVMSNRTNHTQGGDVSGLTTSIGNAVLAP
jgi:CubicO group peptidase (beta-lactamase class C family)